MELLKRSMVLAAVLSAGMALAACQTDGEAGASGSISTPGGAGASGGVSGEAGGSIEAPESKESDAESSQ